MSGSATPMPRPRRDLEFRLTQARSHASAAILAERAILALRVPALLTSGYVIAGLLRIPQSMPDTLHAILLGGVAAGVAVTAIRGLSRVERPTIDVVDRRVEQASRLSFQPLQSLRDHPVEADRNGLWSAHLTRTVGGIGNLRGGWPHPRLTRATQLGGAIVVAALVLTGMRAGTHAPSRLLAAFVPGYDDADVPLPQIEAWIDMPDYAPGAPVFLNGRSGSAKVPQGAHLNATINGTVSAPTLSGARVSTMQDRKLDARSWALNADLTGSGDLSIQARGRQIAQWHLEVEPDLAPGVAWNGTPAKEEDGWRTLFPWKVSQAHGVKSLLIEIKLANGKTKRVLSLPIDLGGMPKSANGSTPEDLASDPWAGEQVSATLVARSASNLEARSASVKFVLPSRVFHDPVAKALVALRRRLALEKEDRATAADELRTLTEVMPSSQDGAIIAMDYAASRLEDPQDPHAIDDALGLMWSLALYLEDLRATDPDAALANLDVRAAQTAVQQQLDHMKALGPKGHTLEQQEELGRRMQTLKDALARRMQALMRQAMLNGMMMPDMGQDEGDANDAFSRLMRRLQSDADNGRGDDAMKRLQQLESMTEKMRNATPQDLANLARQLRAQAEAHAQRRALHDVIKHETKLLDHAQSRLNAVRRAQSTDQDVDQPDISNMSTTELLKRLGLQPPPGLKDAPAVETPPPDPSTLDPATRARQDDERRADHAVQSALKRVGAMLNDDVKDLTDSKLKSLEKAVKDMDPARHALGRGNDVDAQKAEAQVLKDLADAGKEMSQAQKSKSQGHGTITLLPGLGSPDKQGAKGTGHGRGDEDGDGERADPNAKDRDPLGRKLGEGDDDVDTDSHIPEASQRDRAREIEKELRRRDADRTRPQEELDYLDRLLKSY